MHPSRSFARSLVLVVVGLSLAACGATTPPSVRSDVPSAPVASSTPAVSTAVSPSATPIAVATVVPVDSLEPEAPTPRPTQIAGCGTGETGFTAHRSEIPKVLAFGHATIEFTPTGVSMRDGSYDTGDSIPGGVGLTANEIAVVVGSGDHIILRATGLALANPSATASPWSMVTFRDGLADIGGRATALAVRVRSDGSMSVSAPSTVGDWAITFYPRWQGACLQGDGTAYARIKVR